MSSEGNGVYPESCLSSGGLLIGDVVRPWTATFSYLTVTGVSKVLKANPIYTRLLLHESDHLQGKICTDHYVEGTTRIAGGANEVLNPKLKRID